MCRGGARASFEPMCQSTAPTVKSDVEYLEGRDEVREAGVGRTFVCRWSSLGTKTQLTRRVARRRRRRSVGGSPLPDAARGCVSGVNDRHTVDTVGTASRMCPLEENLLIGVQCYMDR